MKSIYDDGWGKCKHCRVRLSHCRCGMTHYCPDCGQGSMQCTCEGPFPKWRTYLRRSNTEAYRAATVLAEAALLSKRNDQKQAARLIVDAMFHLGSSLAWRKAADLCEPTS